MREAFDKAYAEAEKFCEEHPVFRDALVTVVAIGILVLVMPWAVEALGWVLLEGMGFEEVGVVEGKPLSIPCFCISFLICHLNMSISNLQFLGSFAAWWQSTFPEAEAGSFFSYLQRMGMTWGRK